MIHLTHHAYERAIERAGLVPDLALAVPVAVSVARYFLGWRPSDGWYERPKNRYYVTPSLILIVRDDDVVTCCAITLEDLALTLVAVLFRERPPGVRT